MSSLLYCKTFSFEPIHTKKKNGIGFTRKNGIVLPTNAKAFIPESVSYLCVAHPQKRVQFESADTISRKLKNHVVFHALGIP